MDPGQVRHSSESPVGGDQRLGAPVHSDGRQHGIERPKLGMALVEAQTELEVIRLFVVPFAIPFNGSL